MTDWKHLRRLAASNSDSAAAAKAYLAGLEEVGDD